MKRAATWIATLLPLLIMAGWTMRNESVVRNGKTVELAVTGYDPRILLSGHYLRYQVDYAKPALCAEELGKKVCVCLTPKGDGPRWIAAWSGNCEEKEECETWIQGRCDYDGFHAGIERFYFPEALSDQLLRVPPNATIRIHVNSAGVGIVTDFLVDGEPLPEWAKHQAKRR